MVSIEDFSREEINYISQSRNGEGVIQKLWEENWFSHPQGLS